MNIRKNIILLFLLFMVLPTIVKADDYSYNMQIKENASYLNDGDKINGGSFTIRYDASIFDIVSFDTICTGVQCKGL